MRSTLRTSLVALVAAVLAAGCGKGQILLGLGSTPVEVPLGDPTGGPGGPTGKVDVSTCTACHGTPGFSSAGADPLVAVAPPVEPQGAGTSVVGAHRAHLVGGAFSRALECASCHLVPTRGGPHNPASIVFFSRRATTIWTGGHLTPSYGSGSCSSTYCHGNFPNGAGANAIGWTAGPVVVCGSCHELPPAATHSLTDVPNGKACSDCHPGYTGHRGDAPSAFAVNLDTHVNGRLDGGNPHPAGWKEPDQHGLAAISFTAPNNGLASCTTCHVAFGPAGAASSSCNGCHAAPATYGPYTTGTYPTHTNWQTECTFCHGGRDNSTGAPPRDTHVISSNPATQPTTLQTVGAHTSHVGATHGIAVALDCTACHQAVTDVSTPGHIDANRASVVFGNVGITVNPGNYNSPPTCAANYCHGNFVGGSNASPSFTGTFGGAFTLGCTSCHGNPPPASAGHPQNDACATCHGAGYSKTGATTGTVNAATHVDGTVRLVAAESCTSCHGQAGRANGTGTGGAFDANQAAAPPADSHGAGAGVLVGVHLAHVNPASGNVYKPIACTECHPDNAGNNRHAGGTVNLTFAAATGANLASYVPSFTQGNGTSTATSCAVYCHGASLGAGYAGSVTTWSWNGPAATCGSCHGDPPATGGHGGVTSATNCGNCHPGYTASTVNLSLHINGQLDGGGEPPAGGTSCSGCHSTIFAGMDGTVAHSTVHRLALDVPTDDPTVWTSPLSGVAAAARSCVNMCHGDHPHDLANPPVATHEYNVYVDASSQASRGLGTRTSTSRAKTDFTSVTGGMCLSCHKNAVDGARPAIPIAGFDTSAHDFTQFAISGGATYTWQYQLHSGNFDRNCTKCHASSAEGTTPAAGANGSSTVAVHFGDNVNLLAGKRSPAGNPAGFVCYNCHGPTSNPAAGVQGDRSGKNIQSQIARTSNHPAHADAVHDSVAEFNGAAFGNALGGKARHASCLDCHDTHEAKLTGAGRTVGSATTGNRAGPALQGAWGVAFGGALAAWTAPASGNFTKKTIVAGTDLEATLCFKCHSAFYGTLPTSPSGGFAETDQVKEFNPANVGYHPVLASSSGTLGNTGSIKSPFSRTSLMTCTDCHESDVTTDPNGPHGSAAAFILKGPNTVWNRTIAVGAGGMPANTFCINCHNQNFSGGRFTNHTNGQHDIPCMNCHAAIPHGGPRPGMLTAGACAGTGTPACIAGWDSAAPYWQGGATDRLYLVGYPATNTTSWSQGNCGCNGTGH